MAIKRLERNENSEWGSVVFHYQPEKQLNSLISKDSYSLDSITAKILNTLKYGQEDFHFPYNHSTREVFNLDHEWVIRLKCVAITLVTPIVSIVRSIYALATSIFILLSATYYYLEGDTTLTFKASPSEKASDSLRSLTYGAAMTGCAAIGILAPFWARLHYGHLERELNRHGDAPHHDKFYLAFCFQRICVIASDDPNHSDQVEHKLKRYFAHLEEIITLIFNAYYHPKGHSTKKELV